MAPWVLGLLGVGMELDRGAIPAWDSTRVAHGTLWKGQNEWPEKGQPGLPPVDFPLHLHPQQIFKVSTVWSL